jgi:hypothetical protein
MGPELDLTGKIIDPIRCDWRAGCMFVTPPGWWHSHHNESEEEAWVLPMQDAGLYTYQRTLGESLERPCFRDGVSLLYLSCIAIVFITSRKERGLGGLLRGLPA